MLESARPGESGTAQTQAGEVQRVCRGRGEPAAAALLAGGVLRLRDA
jgi:hypothetical protein